MKNFFSFWLILLGVIICDAQVNSFENYEKNKIKKIKYIPEKTIKLNRHNINNELLALLDVKSNIDFVEQQNGIIDDERDYIHIKLKQYYNGIEIESSSLVLHYKNSELTFINGEYLSTLNLDVNFSLTENEAESIAQLSFQSIEFNKDSTIQNYILDNPLVSSLGLIICKEQKYHEDSFRLAYQFEISKIPFTRKRIFVDAINGEIIKIKEKMHSANAETRYNGSKSITTKFNTSKGKYILNDPTRGNGIFTRNWFDIFNFNNGGWRELEDSDNNWTAIEYHNTAKEDALLNAHWAAMKIYDYFFYTHSRKSFNNTNGALQLYVLTDINENMDNARWAGNGIMIFGNGGSDFDTYASVDVVAHEFGHGICESTANLEYEKESGAINESLSDIWGACVRNYALPSSNYWNIGEEIDLRSGHSGMKIMSNPNLEEQPDTYESPTSYWYSIDGCSPNSGNDYCGVHTNAGVMNFWFYLLSEGGIGTNDIGDNYNVSGIGIYSAAQIVYRAETIYMTPTTDFHDARDYTIRAAIDLFNSNSNELRSVIEAWYAVGVGDECLESYISNTTINSTENYSGCMIHLDNVTIQSNGNVTFDAEYDVIIEGELIIEKGSSVKF